MISRMILLKSRIRFNHKILIRKSNKKIRQLKKKVNKIFFIIIYFIEPEIGQQLQELWRIETKNGIVEKMFVEEKDVNEIKKIEEKTLNLRNKMIDEQNDPEYVEKKIKEIQEQIDNSSGLESDNDLDLLVEQEVLQAIKIRKQMKQ